MNKKEIIDKISYLTNINKSHYENFTINTWNFKYIILKQNNS